MLLQDIISDAILSCHIPLAQVYFLTMTGSNIAHDGSLKYIMETGLRIVLEVLAGKDIATATEMIRNMVCWNYRLFFKGFMTQIKTLCWFYECLL